MNPHLPLNVNAVSYFHGANTLLEGLTFQLSTEGITVVLGHNGAGKSLLLKALHGVIKPNRGDIRWHHISPQPTQYWRTLLLQKPRFLHCSVADNLQLVLKIAKIPKIEHAQRCEQALRYCDLNTMATRPAQVLSGGEQQRLSLARAWVLKPDVILLDEPTSQLDPNSTQSIEKLILELRSLGVKIIMTTHNLAQARRLADDILFLHEGKCIEQSSTESFFAEPSSKAVRDFFGSELLS